MMINTSPEFRMSTQLRLFEQCEWFSPIRVGQAVRIYPQISEHDYGLVRLINDPGNPNLDIITYGKIDVEKLSIKVGFRNLSYHAGICTRDEALRHQIIVARGNSVIEKSETIKLIKPIIIAQLIKLVEDHSIGDKINISWQKIYA